jgi:hypothetical protein
MPKETHICTHCGYEGKPTKPPSDAAPGDSESSNAIARVANLILPGMGFLIRPLAMFMMLPIHILLWPLKRAVNGPKNCQNCGLPTMVRISSDAGFVAKRKLDLKMGKRFDRPEPPKIAFGKEVKFGDEDETPPPPPPVPDRLPSLEEMLKETPQPTPPDPEPKPEIMATKKTIDPDKW